MSSSKKDLPSPDEQRDLIIGRTETGWGDNSVQTNKYNLLSFLPLSIGEQFRKYGNVYFLFTGCLMALGQYGGFFETAVSPWTTLGPLAIVISVSLAQEAAADLKRHRNDAVTNSAPCITLRNPALETEELVRNEEIFSGHDLRINDGVSIACAVVPRKDIRAGDIVLVRNREMIPADIVLLASSSENGSAYIETSPIDGETNLKLRTKPTAPEEAALTQRHTSITNFSGHSSKIETLEQAVKRIVRYSILRSKDGNSTRKSVTPASLNPNNPDAADNDALRAAVEEGEKKMRLSRMVSRSVTQQSVYTMTVPPQDDEDVDYVATLTSEAPNASVNTFSGKLTLPPPTTVNTPSIIIPLDADNMLLRGAFLRNTDWVLGVACFTGKDTKLVMNSFATPSKFSQLDLLINRTILRILLMLCIFVLTLGGFAVYYHNSNFDQLWYVGYNENANAPWPYLPLNVGTAPPKWGTTSPNYIQFVLSYITLLTNFVPLSLYVSVEITAFFMMYLIYVDVDIYHPRTDTPAAARNTNITDLGQVQYVFSDKTGTLTQNVMIFKRCSVDGHMYGKPVTKSAPTTNKTTTPEDNHHHDENNDMDDDDYLQNTNYKELPDLLSSSGTTSDVSQVGTTTSTALTFNAEMFLRVMSLCHTVVVEKEFSGTIQEDDEDFQDDTITTKSKKKSSGFKLFSPKKKSTSDNKTRNISNHSKHEDSTSVSIMADESTTTVGLDGAPKGFAYQAESPDEGALVSAAALEYQFQLLGRDSDGVQLACSSPSILQDPDVVEGLKSGELHSNQLASRSPASTSTENNICRKETWTVLAINKFDSTRKRMSVLVRSPPELGSLPILFCKGADSSMLDPNVCEGKDAILSEDNNNNNNSSSQLGKVIEENESFEVMNKEEEEYEQTTLLAIQSHLGTFASEGLRTLVLGLRILTEKQCEDWLTQYKAASTSMVNRDSMLKQCAADIERQMHIVGATAIEDKLQRGVPETISKLEKSGIKLWVLTGDKRETAIEIGYSTKVLTPKMHVTEVADAPPDRVKTLLAMEFIRLVKMGKLPAYQKASFRDSTKAGCLSECFKSIGLFLKELSRGFWRFYTKYVRTLCGLVNASSSKTILDKMDAEHIIMERRKDPAIRCARVRRVAERIIEGWRESPEGIEEHHRYLRKKKWKGTSDATADDDNIFMPSDSLPTVFMRAKSANILMGYHSSSSKLPQQENEEDTPNFIIDPEVLSEKSFRPESGELTNHYNRKKNHFLEKAFAVDRDVRNGRLYKHLTHERRDFLAQAASGGDEEAPPAATPSKDSVDVQRALVIEGAALLHLLGDDLLEEVFFAVASQCDSVIACRVSPKQKALLVKLVRNYVIPEPVTLAIGDGANDVGMIQEAHIGIGISGLEGQQAVNASDFSIAQFRFLEDLLLIHGRWNFSRMSRVILFSFYKNAVLATLLIIYNFFNHFSSTPVFDQWVLSCFNFIAFFPILFLGLFDRDLNKEYVKRHPETYAPGPNNEYITNRTILRWILLTLIHAIVIFFGTLPCVTSQGGMNSAFTGLMKGMNRDRPGDGEGSDIKVFGTLLYSILIVVLIYKVLFECRSLIHGKFPWCTCRKDVGEGVWSRLAYTWYGVTFGSFLFLLFFLYVYQFLARSVPLFTPYIDVTTHMFNYRAVSWMLMIVIPIAACGIDVAIKVFSNMFYPTQIQIHAEIQAAEIAVKRKNRNK